MSNVQNEQNNQDNLPTMDEIINKPGENNDNSAPNSGGNNFSYPTF